MASSAEQLAANINLKAFSKAADLKKRLWFTLFALLVFRFGSYLPLPGIDVGVIDELARQHEGGILGIFNRFSGGALSRMSIFALGVMPYISASIIMQLMTVVSPQLEALKKEGESGRKKINQYTRYGTVLLGGIQGYLLAVGLEAMSGPTGSAVLIPGMFFRVATMITITGGTLFLMWLGEQITTRASAMVFLSLFFRELYPNCPGQLVLHFLLAYRLPLLL
jgi:preprotein translocase subunit SecY